MKWQGYRKPEMVPAAEHHYVIPWVGSVMGLRYSFGIIADRQAVDALLREIAASVTTRDRAEEHLLPDQVAVRPTIVA